MHKRFDDVFNPVPFQQKAFLYTMRVKLDKWESQCCYPCIYFPEKLAFIISGDHCRDNCLD